LTTFRKIPYRAFWLGSGSSGSAGGSGYTGSKLVFFLLKYDATIIIHVNFEISFSGENTSFCLASLS
jgi:hypothetical protein